MHNAKMVFNGYLTSRKALENANYAPTLTFIRPDSKIYNSRNVNCIFAIRKYF